MITSFAPNMDPTANMKPIITLLLMIQAGTAMGELAYSPELDNYPKHLFWGDTHLHTQMSGDAYLFGTRLGHDAAYSFAKGQEVTSSSGQSARLDRPLDFLVIADHANNLGAPYSRGEFARDSTFRDSSLGKLWIDAKRQSLQDPTIDLKKFEGDRLYTVHREDLVSIRHAGFRTAFWRMATAAADRHNDPGKFTALIGYEWTPEGAAHRVVVFRDSAERANQILPFSSYDSRYPEDLWRFLEGYEADTGGEAFSIPHNPNLTSGLMFATVDSLGEPIDSAYAKRRSRWEPLLEVTQTKGDSEAHPYLSPEDEFADFETWNGWAGTAPNPDRPPEKIQFEYARPALKNGLSLAAETGTNPFKFGLIGSTDSHTALATAAEDNYWGKFGRDEPSPDRIQADWPGWQGSAAGYAAVWAPENTREAIFDAMRRRETFASTGPRMSLRFFAGWNFKPKDVLQPDRAKIGYQMGVPMGGDLEGAPEGAATTFMVYAIKDPLGANLDRIQIVKGWLSEDGELAEKVFNVAWSGERRLRRNGSLSVVGNTVNVDEASFTNDIGSAELAAVWVDPEFDRNEYAFYYARVLEIPTPRWTAYDAKYYQLGNLPPSVPMVLQERAYSSPIWYAPTVPPRLRSPIGAP